MTAPSTAGELHIDLRAVQANWRQFGALAPRCDVAAMVKADAYGLGAAAVGPALAAAGAREFFVAEPGEGIELRNAMPDADIFVLSGATPGSEATLDEHRLVPVLLSLGQIERWSAHARRHGGRRASVHFDTGMNRTGLDENETATLLDDPATLDGLDIVHTVSHLACADEPDHEQNARQHARFRAIRARFTPGRASLANSPGVGLGPDYHFDHVRPGVGLYGADPTPDRRLGLRPVVTLTVPVLQVRTARSGETVGYAATHRLGGERRLATIAVGYGDGFSRAGSSRGQIAFDGHCAPIVGRVSMDLVTVDVTDLPADVVVREGTAAELIGPTVSIDAVADAAGTIAYEVLTNLGQRYTRSYTR